MIVVGNDQHTLSKYIYLDWNVFKYMKEPRMGKEDLDTQFKELVKKLKKIYKFPFSYAHIQDRANHYSEQHYKKVEEDLIFVESISDSNCIGIDKGEPVLCKESIRKCFNDYISKKNETKLEFSTSFFNSEFKVDMEKLDKEHLMYESLKNNQGIMSNVLMNKFLEEMFTCIFSDTNEYKKFRKTVNNLKQLHMYEDNEIIDKLLFHFCPFIDSFEYKEEELKNNWNKIAEKWFSFNTSLPIRKEQLLIQGYTLLDIHPLFKEKMKKGKNTLDNIIRDGNHCFYASNGNFFVSEDDYTRKKTSFLYDVYNIKTKVVCENEFMNFFEIL